MEFWWLFLLCPISYIIGSVNFSVQISKFKFKKDIRTFGSGNPGATNMLRSFGFKWAFIIMLLDMFKGLLPSLVGLLLFGYGTESGNIAMYACGLSAVIGHCFPIWYKFKGGKGVATTVGVFFVANPAVAAIALATALLYGIVFEYVSISSFIFVTTCVIWEGLVMSPSMTVCILLFTLNLLILFLHRMNIVRLLTGKERKAAVLAKIQKEKNKIKQQKWLSEI